MTRFYHVILSGASRSDAQSKDVRCFDCGAARLLADTIDDVRMHDFTRMTRFYHVILSGASRSDAQSKDVRCFDCGAARDAQHDMELLAALVRCGHHVVARLDRLVPAAAPVEVACRILVTALAVRRRVARRRERQDVGGVHLVECRPRPAVGCRRRRLLRAWFDRRSPSASPNSIPRLDSCS